MLFTDEDSRHSYHKSPALLQVVCQILETHLAEHGVQLELVDVDKRIGVWIAAVAIDNEMHEDAITSVIDRVNHQFTRADDALTCVLESAEVGLLSVRVTEAIDYSQLS